MVDRSTEQAAENAARLVDGVFEGEQAFEGGEDAVWGEAGLREEGTAEADEFDVRRGEGDDGEQTVKFF